MRVIYIYYSRYHKFMLITYFILNELIILGTRPEYFESVIRETKTINRIIEMGDIYQYFQFIDAKISNSCYSYGNVNSI